MSDLQRRLDYGCSITDLTYNILAYWKSISTNASPEILSDKLRACGCNKSADDVKILCGVARSLKLDQIWFNVRSPTTFYTGRDKEMEKIQKQWKKCEESKRMLIFAVTGLEGLGKSEIARNYAKMFYENEKGHTIWIDAETDHSLLQSLQQLATFLKISLADQSENKRGLRILTTEIYEKLSNQKCLLIFDNLESYENSILCQLIDLASTQPPTIRKPFILITSRFQPANKILLDNCHHLILDVLSKESALNFFSQSFSFMDEDAIPGNTVLLMQKLCEKLQYYPLAMQQAAAYINENISGKSKNQLENEIISYLNDIEKQFLIILGHKLSQQSEVLDDISRTAFLPWGITLDKIGRMPEIGSDAVKMMDMISFLSPDNISTDFLMKIVGSQRFLLQQSSGNEKNCFEILRDHSMISLSEKKISIHRLVQDVTRIRLKERDQLIPCLDTLMTKIMAMLVTNDIPSDQLIHTQIIWGHLTGHEDLIKKYGGDLFPVPNLICRRLHESANYRDVYNFSSQALTTLQSAFGEKSRWALKIKYWKGVGLEALGELSESLEMLEDVYKNQKENFSQDDEDSILTANIIGTVHMGMKNYADALKWFGDALEIRERIKGREDSVTLTLKHNMAKLFSDQGKYQQALEMGEQILEVRERIPGKEDPDTLKTKFNLAIVKYHLQQYEEALKMLQEVLQVQERVLEVDHPHTLDVKVWIAATYVSLRRADQAFQLAKEIHEKREKILGPTHPDTIIAKNSLDGVERLLIMTQCLNSTTSTSTSTNLMDLLQKREN